MANTALNRTTVALLTNKSGGSLAYGAVVVLDNTNAKGFTTTTTSGLATRGIGVILEPNGIANDATGTVAVGGWVPKITLASAATVGQLIKTHTVAGQGTPHSSPQVEGDFAVALQATSTPEAILFGMANAPTASTGVTFAAADRLLGRDTAGAGASEEISLAAGDLEFTGSQAIQARFIGARVHNNSVVQVIANNSTTALTASTESFDTDALHDAAVNTSRLTAPVDGYYLVNCHVFWEANSTGKRVVDFRSGGATFFGTRDFEPDGGDVQDPHMGSTSVVQLSAAGYVEVMVYQNCGTDLDCTLTEFSMVRLPGA